MFTFWKETGYKKDTHYRFQTDESKIKTILNKQKNLTLIGIGVNCKLWLYRTQFKSIQLAKATFKRIKGKIK